MNINTAREILSEHAWKHPSDYGGFSPDGDYCVISRNRDSQILDESNWDAARATLAAVAYDDGREGFSARPPSYDWRAGHWACGWVEYLMVRHDAPDALIIAAAEIVSALSNYPLLDESDYSQRQHDAICDYWQQSSLRARVDQCREAGVSIFSARSDCIPEFVYDQASDSGAFC